MKIIGKAFDALEKGIKVICGVLATGFTIMTLISVIARYVLNAPIWWSEQFCRYLFVWMLMLYAPIIVRHNKNLGFDLVVSKLPKIVQETGCAGLQNGPRALPPQYRCGPAWGRKCGFCNSLRTSPNICTGRKGLRTSRTCRDSWRRPS